MNWKVLSEEGQLPAIMEESKERPVVLFKHSTRCSISSMAKSRLERSTQPENMSFYYLDLIRYRGISNKIADDFQVAHESPQVLVIRNGECIYDESHNGIQMADLAEFAQVP